MKFSSRAIWIAVGICVAILALLRVQVMSALGSYLVRAEPPRKADLAIVLAGGADGLRILKAGSLVQDGYAPVALISGPSGVYGWYECDLAIPFAVKRGYPEGYFAHMEHNAKSTAEEAQAMIPEIRRRGAKTVLLVTSNYHTRRATNLFRATAPEVTFIPIAAPDQDFSPDSWWHSRQGQKTFLMEWEKTVAVWVGL